MTEIQCPCCGEIFEIELQINFHGQCPECKTPFTLTLEWYLQEGATYDH